MSYPSHLLLNKSGSRLCSSQELTSYAAGLAGLELQWRKSGDEMWQFANKATESAVKFTPPDSLPGAPEKFEFRGVYLKKNKRIGQWSPTYAVTVS